MLSGQLGSDGLSERTFRRASEPGWCPGSQLKANRHGSVFCWEALAKARHYGYQRWCGEIASTSRAMLKQPVARKVRVESCDNERREAPG